MSSRHDVILGFASARLCAIACLAIIAGCQSGNSGSRQVIVQPDYENWNAIKPGMTEAEVNALIGRPIFRQDANPTEVTGYIARYGILRFDEQVFPGEYGFDIHYESSSCTVQKKVDPFHGVFSDTGVPTAPRLVTPAPEAVFDHYPRFADFRWAPASGKYPIRYEVQFNHDPESGWTAASVFTRQSPHPYCAISWVGKNEGVWRVRGINSLGTGPWSEERRFSFNR